MNTEITNKKAENQAAVSVSVIETQLRVGNYIRDISSKRIGYVKSIKAKLAVKMEFSTLIQKSEYFEGILINEKSMLILGVKEVIINHIVINNDMESFFNVEIDILGRRIRAKSYFRIQYIHQLQNLYSKEIGSELQISCLTEH